MIYVLHDVWADLTTLDKGEQQQQTRNAWDPADSSGCVTDNLGKNLKITGVELGVEPVQKVCLLGSARVLGKVLDTRTN